MSPAQPAPVTTLIGGLLDLLYPPKCLVCGAIMDGGCLCESCLAAFPRITPLCCERCHDRLAPGERLCRACARGNEPPYLWISAVGEYSGGLRRAIHRFKYDGRTALRLPLGRALASSLPTFDGEPPHFDVVAPTPLHPAKQRQRGYNQAELLAAAVAEIRGERLCPDALKRLHRGESQTMLHAGERASNVAGAFAVNRRAVIERHNVLLIDDVVTTTATVRECARVLMAAGAKSVCVAALARD